MKRTRRTPAQMLAHARMHLSGCEGLAAAGERVRPHVEALRADYANKGDAAGLYALLEVSDVVARWESQRRNVRRLRYLIARLGGAA